MSTVDPNQAKSATTATFATALVFNAAVFGAEIVAFTLLRPYFKSIYSPRTFVPPQGQRTDPLIPTTSSAASILWPIYLFRADCSKIQQTNGLDAYFFVRFLRFLAITFLPIWIITWAVLMPITSVGSRVGSNSGLDLFVFGNVQRDLQVRYWAHLACFYVLTFWVYHNIVKEFRHFVVTRQRYLLSPEHSRTVQANTVLITGIPIRYLNHAALRKVFGVLPGGVKNIWINRDLKELPELYDRRLKACNKLEAAETKLLGLATKLSAKGELKSENSDSEKPHPGSAPIPRDQRPTHKLGFLGLFGEKVDTIDWSREEIRVTTQLLEEGRAKIPGYSADGGTVDFADDSDDEEDYGKQGGIVGVATKVGRVGEKVGQRVGKVGDRVGEKVGDTLIKGTTLKKKPRASTSNETEDSHQDQQSEPTSEHPIVQKGAEEENISPISKPSKLEKRNKPDHQQQHIAEKEDPASSAYPPINSAFITFHRQIGAQLAGQVLVHHEPYRMAEKHVETSPGDVIWGNLGLNPYEKNVRMLISWGCTAALIIFWAVPVAFVGTVSNIYTVCSTVKWLNWICTLPKPVVGIISGILPPVLLAVLFMLLPIVLRLLAQFEGIPTRSGVELSLMSRFFAFLIIHGFLIVSLSSGIIPAISDFIKNPTGIPGLLAQSLPKASTFFLAYVILQGLSGTAGGFLQIVGLIIYYVKLFLLGSTPRSVWGLKYGMGSVKWGTLWPGITLLGTIAFAYSIVSPVINGLACATFFAFYQMYKYLFLYVYDQRGAGLPADTGGKFFVKGLRQVWAGLYIQQIVMAALFFLAQDANGDPSSIPQGALAVVLIGITIIFHRIIDNSYRPLEDTLPLTLVDKMYAETEEELKNGEFAADAEQPKPEAEADRREDDIEGKRAQVGEGKGEETGEDQVPPNPLPSEEELEQKYGFVHPAASRPQRPIWLPTPVDEVDGGKGREWAVEEVRQCRAAGVQATREGARMDAKGRVDC